MTENQDSKTAAAAIDWREVATTILVPSFDKNSIAWFHATAGLTSAQISLGPRLTWRGVDLRLSDLRIAFWSQYALVVLLQEEQEQAHAATLFCKAILSLRPFSILEQEGTDAEPNSALPLESDERYARALMLCVMSLIEQDDPIKSHSLFCHAEALLCELQQGMPASLSLTMLAREQMHLQDRKNFKCARSPCPCRDKRTGSAKQKDKDLLAVKWNEFCLDTVHPVSGYGWVGQILQAPKPGLTPSVAAVRTQSEQAFCVTSNLRVRHAYRGFQIYRDMAAGSASDVAKRHECLWRAVHHGIAVSLIRGCRTREDELQFRVGQTHNEEEELFKELRDTVTLLTKKENHQDILRLVRLQSASVRQLRDSSAVTSGHENAEPAK